MKYSVLSIAAVVFVAVACSSKDFDFSSSQISEYPKRGSQSKLDELFLEACEDDQQLQNIREEVAEALEHSQEADVAVAAHQKRFERYFKNAEQLSTSIGDSTLQASLKHLLQRKLLTLQRAMSTNNHLVGEILEHSQGVKDQYAALKILSTLPMIEQHATDEKPAEQELRELKKHIQQLEQQLQQANQPQL